MQPGQQLGHFKRLDQIIIGAFVKAGHLIFHTVTSCQQQNFALVFFCTQTFTQSYAIKLRHHPIQNQNIIAVTITLLISSLAVFHPVSFDIFLFQQILQ